ncbi:DEKNAAC104535 [Brettanomyces naardenensis]|uniref:DEKNAAC104535 n=1 Tax=Brettanomyces naardenensis TaxID=13370 RepID=A0A448YRP9_BRENA|nr:DEKNAAC104535 [Brettanomyces naardenensis]
MTYTILYGLTTFAAQFNSTTMTSNNFLEEMESLYHLSRECALLGTALYILGIAFGPMMFAPMSEMYGRKVGVFIPFFISSLFTFATSISYNVAGIMVTRFFAGFFSGAPIVSAGGVLADIWSPGARGAAFGLYACFVSTGPSFGPVLSSLLISSSSSSESWRIPQWFIGLVDLFMIALCLSTLEETYEPVILSWRARDRRLDSKQWNIHSLHDTWKFDLRETVSVHLIRPFAMLATPIVFLMALYASYVYGLFYLIITNVPEAFFLTKGWEGTQGTLPLISLFLGVVTGSIFNMLWARRYAQIIDRSSDKTIPEQRLPIMMMAGWLMPVGIFIFGWTCNAKIHWIAPCIGIAFIGAGFITIFQGSINYLVDSFTKYSASAIAANTFLRSVFAASFPLFAKQLFVNLQVSWGSSLIGFIALGMIPIPFFFFKYGRKIRAKNPYSNRVS